MHEILHKFPSTPHLTWLGNNKVRDNKILNSDEVRAFISQTIVVEEKIDGANLGLSFDKSGKMLFQNRGNWLTGKFIGQWDGLRGWAAKRETLLRKKLPAGHILFGEWCFAKHSVYYEYLPDWFLVFDVFETSTGKFWNSTQRNSLAESAKLAVVPEVARGVFDLHQLLTLLQTLSCFGDVPCEGLYLRREQDWLEERAKLVRPEFTQSITEHWSRHCISPNHLRQSCFMPSLKSS
jgi:RNA ligase